MGGTGKLSDSYSRGWVRLPCCKHPIVSPTRDTTKMVDFDSLENSAIQTLCGKNNDRIVLFCHTFQKLDFAFKWYFIVRTSTGLIHSCSQGVLVQNLVFAWMTNNIALHQVLTSLIKIEQSYTYSSINSVNGVRDWYSVNCATSSYTVYTVINIINIRLICPGRDTVRTLHCIHCTELDLIFRVICNIFWQLVLIH